MHGGPGDLSEVRSSPPLQIRQLLDFGSLLNELCSDSAPQIGGQFVEFVAAPRHGFRALDIEALMLRSLPGLSAVGRREWEAVW
jgi:hypothetical protein